MDDKNKEFKPEGVSMRDIEQLTGKYLHEGFIVLTVLCASISSYFEFITGSFLSLISCTIGVAVSIFCFKQVDPFATKVQSFIFRQDKMIALIIGGLRVIIGIFLSWVVFALVGVLAGIGFSRTKQQSSPTA